ncbi:MAG: flagellar FliJ protein [Candidatus Pelagisphaera sp.]|jgi:flagellar FliJ protein
MKKFVFSLESVLGLREWEEQASRQAFTEVSSEVTLLEERIRNMESESAGVFEKWNTSFVETFTRNDRMVLMGSVDSMRRQKVEVTASLEEANLKREEALKKLTQAVRNKKIVENLKEKRLEDYQAESILHEALEIEDIYNARRKERGNS